MHRGARPWGGYGVSIPGVETLRQNQHRLFFALWPGTAERAALAAWQSPLHGLCGGKAMRVDTLHCTLVFLGEVPGHRLEALVLAAHETHMGRFSLQLDAAHYWDHNHIVCAVPALLPPEQAALVAGLQDSLCRHRFHFERRPYKAHVTLLRHARWTDAALPPMPAVRWQASEFVLVESVRDGQGVRYEVLGRFGARG